MATSEARIAANLRNSRLSTGPRSAEGKRKSRQNAVKHGLTGAGVVLAIEDAEVIANRFDSLREQFDPRTPMGGILVKRIAMLSVRLDRSYRRENSALAVRIAGAEAAITDARKADAEYLLNHIMEEPRTNQRRLMATPEGVDMLVDAWETMRIELEHQEGTKWSYTQATRVEYLLGHDPMAIGTTAYLAWTRALNGTFTDFPADYFAQGMTKDQKQDLALTRLQELVTADLAKIREHRATMDTAAADARMAHAKELALFDDSKEGILARKYEAATERGIFRALEELRLVEAEADLTPIVKDEPEKGGPPGTLASFFSGPAEPIYEASRPAWAAETGPVPALDKAETVNFTVGRRPSGPS